MCLTHFDDHGLQGGVWRGVLRADSQPGRVVLTCLGRVVAHADLTPAADGGWQVAVPLPADTLCDGAQTFLLLADDGTADREPGPGAQHLAHLPLLAGAPLDQDLQAEINLLRAEMDLLKRELRRLARRCETG